MVCDIYLNLSNETDAQHWIEDGWWPGFIHVLSPIVTAIGLVNNVLFVFTILRIRRMKTSLNGFLVNLAVSDSIFLIITACIHIPSYNNAIGRLDLPVSTSVGCLGIDTSIFIWYFTSVTFVTAVVLERYYAVTKPLRHRVANANKRSRTTKLVAVTWIVGFASMVVNVPYFLVDTLKHCIIWPELEQYDKMPLMYSVCRSTQDHELSTSTTDKNLVPFIIWGLSFVVIVNINAILSLLIIVNVWKQDNRRRIYLSASSKAERASVQVALTLVVNGLLVILCQTPYHLYHLNIAVDHFSNGTLDLLPDDNALHFTQESFATFALGGLVINAAINPLIYALGSRFYRNALLKL